MATTQDGTGQAELGKMEWAIFRKGGDPGQCPAENLTYETREAAEKTIKRSYREPKLWEVRGRVIGPWSVAA